MAQNIQLFGPREGFLINGSSRETIAFILEYVVLSILRKNNYIFRSRKIGAAPLLYVDVEMFGEKWREIDIKTSKWRQNRHTDAMHENRLTPLM